MREIGNGLALALVPHDLSTALPNTPYFMELPAFLEGRQGRFAYAAQLLVIFLPILVAYPPADTANWIYLLLATLLVIVCTGTAALLAVRRFHDLGLSG